MSIPHRLNTVRGYLLEGWERGKATPRTRMIRRGFGFRGRDD